MTTKTYNIICCAIIFLINFAVSALSQPITLSDIVCPHWKDGDWFIIEEWTRSEVDGRSNRPWRKEGTLQLTIKKGNNEVKNCKWIIQLKDINDWEVGINIYTINVYYDKKLNIIGAKGYTTANKSITIMDEHGWRYTMLEDYFFQVPKEARSIILERQDSESFKITGKSEAYRIELEKKEYEISKYQVWKKNTPWWIYLEAGKSLKYWLIYSSEEEKK